MREGAAICSTKTMVPEFLRGRYEDFVLIGEGGMGQVWSCLDNNLKRRVALKVIRSEFLDSRSIKMRLKRECRALARLRHPSIVPVFDFIEDRGQVAFTMQLVNGTSSE